MAKTAMRFIFQSKKIERTSAKKIEKLLTAIREYGDTCKNSR